MIKADQIVQDATQRTLSNFLKYSLPGYFAVLNLQQVQILQNALDQAYAVAQQNQRPREIVQKMLNTRRIQFIPLPQNQEIQQIKQELRNWKISFIMALFGILAYITNPSKNRKTIEKYEFDSSSGKQIGITTNQEINPSGWSWLWIGIVAAVVIIISLCAFLNTEAVRCGVKIKGVISRQQDELEERERALRQLL